jgi:hypothetical protein
LVSNNVLGVLFVFIRYFARAAAACLKWLMFGWFLTVGFSGHATIITVVEASVICYTARKCPT